MGRDFQRVLRFGGKQDQVKLVSLSVVLNCGNVDSVCPHLSSDAGHSQARSAQCLRGIGIAGCKPDGQSCVDGTRRDCSTQRADAHYQHLHCEASKMPAMRLKPTSCLKNRSLSPPLPATGVIFDLFWRRDVPIRGALHTWHSLSECETSAIISISTQEPNGISAPPWEVRACAPHSPKTSRRSSEAPSATWWDSVKPGALFTSTIILTIRFTLFRSPRADCNVARISMATSRAACLPSAVVICCPSLPENGWPSFLASRPDR